MLLFSGVGWSEYDDDIGHLVYRKWHLKDQACCLDVALIGKTLHGMWICVDGCFCRRSVELVPGMLMI